MATSALGEVHVLDVVKDSTKLPDRKGASAKVAVACTGCQHAYWHALIFKGRRVAKYGLFV